MASVGDRRSVTVLDFISALLIQQFRQSKWTLFAHTMVPYGIKKAGHLRSIPTVVSGSPLVSRLDERNVVEKRQYLACQAGIASRHYYFTTLFWTVNQPFEISEAALTITPLLSSSRILVWAGR